MRWFKLSEVYISFLMKPIFVGVKHQIKIWSAQCLLSVDALNKFTIKYY